MSISSFVPTVWEKELLTQFRGIAVANLITTAPTRVEGGKAIFNKVSGGTIKDYTGTVDYDELATAPIELTYNIKKYWGITLDDVDAVQAAAPLLSTIAGEKALDLKEAIDESVFAKAVDSVTSANTIGSKSAKKAITAPEQAYDFIVDLGTKLSKKKVPMASRFVCASAEFINLLAKDKRFCDNFNVLPNGIVQGATINGMTIIQTEDAPANTVLCLHKSAIGFATEMDKVEAIRLQNSFADAVRGLQVTGLETLRPEGIAVLYYEVSEAQA